MGTERLTIIIPTLNRSSFIARLVQYYRDAGFRGCLMLGDSSNAEHLERTRRAIQELHPPFDVIHREFPGKHHFECNRVLAASIRTPYVTYVCDDDLLATDTLVSCMEFLDEHPDYSAAMGVGTMVELAVDGAYGPVAGTGVYRMRGLEAERASQRLTDLMRDYTVIAFSVNRTEQFRDQWNTAPGMSQPGFAIEVFPCSLIVVQGKVKQLDRLFVVRHNHRQRYPLPVGFDWLTHASWLPSYQVYRDRLAQALVRQDRISEDEAREVVKRAFVPYVSGQLMAKLANALGPPPPTVGARVRKVARGIPKLRRALRVLRSYLPGSERRMYLETLLRPSCRYHADFMPIYRALTHGGLTDDRPDRVGTQRVAQVGRDV